MLARRFGSDVRLAHRVVVLSKPSYIVYVRRHGTNGAKVGAKEGAAVGLADGAKEGAAVGLADGATEGPVVGGLEGATVGDADGATEGDTEGRADGALVGAAVGAAVGVLDGLFDGIGVGCGVGRGVGRRVGRGVGLGVGRGVTSRRHASTPRNSNTLTLLRSERILQFELSEDQKNALHVEVDRHRCAQLVTDRRPWFRANSMGRNHPSCENVNPSPHSEGLISLCAEIKEYRLSKTKTTYIISDFFKTN